MYSYYITSMYLYEKLLGNTFLNQKKSPFLQRKRNARLNTSFRIPTDLLSDRHLWKLRKSLKLLKRSLKCSRAGISPGANLKAPVVSRCFTLFKPCLKRLRKKGVDKSGWLPNRYVFWCDVYVHTSGSFFMVI